MPDRHLVHALEVVSDWLLVLEGRTVSYVNQGALDGLGLSREDVEGRELSRVLAQATCDELESVLSEAEDREGRLVERDVTCEDPTRGQKIYHLRAQRKAGYTYLSISNLENGNLENVDRLMELEDRLAAFLSLTTSAGIGVVVFEIVEDGLRLRSINQHGAALFGRTERELLSTNPIQFVAPEDQERARDSLMSLMEEGSAEPLMVRVLDPDGEAIHLRMTQTMLSSASGMLGIGFIQDETPVIDALDQANQMVQAIERVQETVILGDPLGRIIYTNPAALRNSGYTFEEVVGKPISIFGSPEGINPQQDTALRELMTKGWYRGDVMACTKDGKRYPVELSASIVRNDEGKVNMIVVVSRKVEERQRFEARLMMVKHNADHVRDVIEHQMMPELERSVDAIEDLLNENTEGPVGPEELSRLARDLRSVVERSKGLFQNLHSDQRVEDMRSINLANMLSERLPQILERIKAQGRDLEIEIDVEDGGVEVMANWMLPELITRLLLTLDQLAGSRPQRFVITIDSIPMAARPDIGIPTECGPKDLCFARISISSKGLSITDELKGVLARREMPTMGGISSEVTFAVETSRLIVFYYKGQILVDDADPDDPEGGTRVSVVLPLAGTQPPSHIQPLDDVDLRYL